jgi:hypothetical protein
MLGLVVTTRLATKVCLQNVPVAVGKPCKGKGRCILLEHDNFTTKDLM